MQKSVTILLAEIAGGVPRMERTGAEGLAGSPGSGGSRAVCNEGGLQLSEPGFIEACASFDRHEAEEGGIPF